MFDTQTHYSSSHLDGLTISPNDILYERLSKRYRSLREYYRTIIPHDQTVRSLPYDHTVRLIRNDWNVIKPAWARLSHFDHQYRVCHLKMNVRDHLVLLLCLQHHFPVCKFYTAGFLKFSKITSKDSRNEKLSIKDGFQNHISETVFYLA